MLIKKVLQQGLNQSFPIIEPKRIRFLSYRPQQTVHYVIYYVFDSHSVKFINHICSLSAVWNVKAQELNNC